MVQYYVSSTTEEDTNEVGGPREWNSDAEDLIYENSPADLEEDDGNSGLQQELNVNFVEDFHKYPRRSRKWSNLYSQNDTKYPERARALISTYDEEKLKHPEIVNEMLMAANNEENSKYPEDESRLSPTYDEDDLKCLEEAKALSSVYDDYNDQSDQASANNANLDEDSLKYAEAPQGPTRSLFQEASPEFRIERNLQSNRIYVKQPKFLDQTKELAVSSAGSRRAFSPQRRQPPAALKTFGAVSRRLYSARPALPTAEVPQSQTSAWGEESDGGAREVLKRTRNTLLKDLEAASAAASASASASATASSREGAPLAPARRESPVASQRRTRSISTNRTPSLPSSLRPSSSPRPQSSAAATAAPQAAEDVLDQNARRDLYMRYSYIPSWVFLARRHDTLFAKVLDYFFKHSAWPDFQRLPEAFRNVCVQFNVEAHHMKRMPGFAPVWLFALRKMDHRYFRATVDHFFDHKVFPHWNWLPQDFVRQFEELGIHERHYFT